jgi:hypothetical protein
VFVFFDRILKSDDDDGFRNVSVFYEANSSFTRINKSARRYKIVSKFTPRIAIKDEKITTEREFAHC